MRRATLVNRSGEPVALELLDGIQNLLPHGIERRFQLEFSTLADGYKSAELEPDTGLALFRLSAIPVDKAEPSEALRATTVWSHGAGARRAGCSPPCSSTGFRRGHAVEQETERARAAGRLLPATRRSSCGPVSGRLVHRGRRRPGRGRASSTLLKLLRERPRLRRRVEEDVERGHAQPGADRGQRRRAAGDRGRAQRPAALLQHALQRDARRRSRSRLPDLALGSRRPTSSRPTETSRAGRRRSCAPCPRRCRTASCWRASRRAGDPDLERLVIGVPAAHLQPPPRRPQPPLERLLDRGQGRAGREDPQLRGQLARHLPELGGAGALVPRLRREHDLQVPRRLDGRRLQPLPGRRATASTGRSLDPHDPWSPHRLLGRPPGHLPAEAARGSPTATTRARSRTCWTARLHLRQRPLPHQALRGSCSRIPHATIDFDCTRSSERDRRRVAELGADGEARLRRARAGSARQLDREAPGRRARASSSNFVPEAGIWMNTQRPEWNDANNALVGYGVSMVTLCYLRRYPGLLPGAVRRAPARRASRSRPRWPSCSRGVAGALERHAAPAGRADLRRGPQARPGRPRPGRQRLPRRASTRRLLGRARRRCRRPSSIAFCDVALRHLDHSIRANRREDGLYHAYNLMKVVGRTGSRSGACTRCSRARWRCSSSGALSARRGGRRSWTRCAPAALYRADQSSYILYPDRRLPRFLEKNNIPEPSAGRRRAC